MDLTFDEKIRRIEEGASAAEVHQDPNTTMTFTSFVGPDPGAKPGDEDHTTKRKREGEAHLPAAKRAKPAPATKNTLATPTIPAPDLTAAVPSTPAATASAPPNTPASSGPSRVRLWQEDEVMFVLEKYAEWPEVNSVELSLLINEEFEGTPEYNGGPQSRRPPRTRQAVWQRFAGKGVAAALLSRLNEQANTGTANTSTASNGTAAGTQAASTTETAEVEEEVEEESEEDAVTK